MATKNITLEEADDHLRELVNQIKPGDEVIITQDDQPKVKLVPVSGKAARKERVFDQHPDKAWMSDDFNAPLPDNFWLRGQP